jgi:hypothetical protein
MICEGYTGKGWKEEIMISFLDIIPASSWRH